MATVKHKTMPLWLGLLFGLFTVCGLAFNLTYNLILGRPVTRLEMTRSSYIAFGGQTITTPSHHTVRVQVLFDDASVEGLQQAVFLLRNTGNRVVTHSADEQLYIEFPAAVDLLTAELGGAPEGDLSFHVSASPDDHRVYVDFARLKPREEFSCSVFFRGDLGSDTPWLKGRSLAQLVTTASLGQRAETPPSFLDSLYLGASVAALVSFLIYAFSLGKRIQLLADRTDAAIRKADRLRAGNVPPQRETNGKT